MEKINIVQKVVRWKRQTVYFDAFIDLATIHIWIKRFLLVDRFIYKTDVDDPMGRL